MTKRQTEPTERRSVQASVRLDPDILRALRHLAADASHESGEHVTQSEVVSRLIEAEAERRERERA